ncbi:hypothetical protein GDO81_010406 [Engystomops pustulosus]|uniref:RNA ligase 1 n=1 Tax=Engystomops pustulosus TaxID=76066 RepID=A0AAV7BZR5_ENGPU|nr:hypothetical protein GDO81_010406 [Engystomops pustulosus]
MMERGSVQQKISCVFVTQVKDEPSSKREHQMFKVLATETLNPLALNAGIDSALATEKVDGTCCYVTTHKGLPYLWARYDRKPTKQAEKRFKKYLYSKGSSKGARGRSFLSDTEAPADGAGLAGGLRQEPWRSKGHWIN